MSSSLPLWSSVSSKTGRLSLTLKFSTIFNSEFVCQFQRKNMKAMTSRLMTSLDDQETILYQGQHQVVLRIVRTSYLDCITMYYDTFIT